jgi:hypothetical protein
MDEEGVPIFFTKGSSSESDTALHCRKSHDPATPYPPPPHAPIKKNKHGRISGFNWRAMEPISRTKMRWLRV